MLTLWGILYFHKKLARNLDKVCVNVCFKCSIELIRNLHKPCSFFKYARDGFTGFEGRGSRYIHTYIPWIDIIKCHLHLTS